MIYFHPYTRIPFLLTRLLVILAVLLIKPSTIFAASGAESNDTFPLQRFLDLEIESISLSTLPEDIPVILEGAGYSQTGDSTFFREAPIPGGRKSIYRITVEDTAKLRRITYSREEIGGRNKSPAAKNRPVPDNEAIWANALYELVCLHVADEIRIARACQPLADWQIRFGEGSFLSLSDKAGAQLDASGTSTILEVAYFKE